MSPYRLIPLLVVLIGIVAVDHVYEPIRPSQRAPEYLCLKGRQYVYIPPPSPTLALVLTRNKKGSAVAMCGEETPEDFAELVKRIHENLNKVMEIEDEELSDEEIEAWSFL
jgi:hypothetical protein